ncbi:MAG: rRNA maturation RNase YbeY [bacterium]|jgi:probable rRNA maturation factor|nr:rRNA maturation RNase YbeY [Myxococcota bacterium]
MSVAVSNPPEYVDARRLDIPLQKKRARAVLRALGHAKSDLSVGLVGDVEIRELNRDYRDKNRATDVLSFSLVEGEWSGFRGTMLGDVVISIETAARQARARHRSLNEEVTRLLIHGILHLLGHDHEEDEEARTMRAEERRLSTVCRS